MGDLSVCSHTHSSADKQTCDEYFTNKHRGEMRGCSGIFFDHLRTPNKRAAFDFIVALGRSFNALYGAFVDANRDMPYTPVRSPAARLGPRNNT